MIRLSSMLPFLTQRSEKQPMSYHNRYQYLWDAPDGFATKGLAVESDGAVWAAALDPQGPKRETRLTTGTRDTLRAYIAAASAEEMFANLRYLGRPAPNYAEEYILEQLRIGLRAAAERAIAAEHKAEAI
ncbi:MAG: hypothetical protein K0R61_3616 [Microvirga sp.]|nr:hypothetical protein [Microvirga sp.]